MMQGGRVTSSFELQDCVAVSVPGGGDGSPVVIWPQPITVDDARYFLLRTTSDWICRFVAGRSTWNHPLGKFAILETVRDACAVADDSGVAINVNAKRKRAHRRADHCDCMDIAWTISLPRMPSGDEFVELRAIRRGRDIYLELSPISLTWLYEWCASKDHSKRDVVRHSKTEDERSATKGLFFSRAHGAWLARYRGGQKKFPVCAVDASGATLAVETYRALLASRRADAEVWLREQQSPPSTSSCGESASGCVESGAQYATAYARSPASERTRSQSFDRGGGVALQSDDEADSGDGGGAAPLGSEISSVQWEGADEVEDPF